MLQHSPTNHLSFRLFHFFKLLHIGRRKLMVVEKESTHNSVVTGFLIGQTHTAHFPPKNEKAHALLFDWACTKHHTKYSSCNILQLEGVISIYVCLMGQYMQDDAALQRGFLLNVFGDRKPHTKDSRFKLMIQDSFERVRFLKPCQFDGVVHG